MSLERFSQCSVSPSESDDREDPCPLEYPLSAVMCLLSSPAYHIVDRCGVARVRLSSGLECRAYHVHFMEERCRMFGIDIVACLERARLWLPESRPHKGVFYRSDDNRLVTKVVTEREFSCMLDLIPVIGARGTSTLLLPLLGMFAVEDTGLINQALHLVVMPNLAYGMSGPRLLDLKGTDSTAVMPAVPVAGENAEQLHGLLAADCEFLCGQEIMDYSLLVAIDDRSAEIRVALIDYFTRYTLERRLESQVKTFGRLLRTVPTAPTIIEPVRYKRRFLDFIKEKFVVVAQPSPSSLRAYRSRTQSCRPRSASPCVRAKRMR